MTTFSIVSIIDIFLFTTSQVFLIKITFKTKISTSFCSSFHKITVGLKKLFHSRPLKFNICKKIEIYKNFVDVGAFKAHAREKIKFYCKKSWLILEASSLTSSPHTGSFKSKFTNFSKSSWKVIKVDALVQFRYSN